MKYYTCIVKLKFSGGFVEAKNKKDYLKKIKRIFFEQYELEIDNSEISDIQEHLKTHVNQGKD
mgnify:CR=1 FL=1|tara:strand:- start:660 stop:848 length:189 start_codon:yes stop_codon:yes gene_type:complete